MDKAQKPDANRAGTRFDDLEANIEADGTRQIGHGDRSENVQKWLIRFGVLAVIVLIAIAVVSSDAKGEYCKKLGASGYVNRKDFNHWGRMPDWTDDTAYNEWMQGVRAFGKLVLTVYDGV